MYLGLGDEQEDGFLLLKSSEAAYILDTVYILV
jgi:hypothetical protein